MKIQSYRELDVWQKSMNLVVECYKITNEFPKEELYSLTNQIRRASVSVPRILQKVKVGGQQKNFYVFYPLRKVHCLNLKHN